MIMNRTLIATAGALVAFAIGNQVLAQTTDRANDQNDRRQARIQRMCQGIDARLDGRLSFLQSRLKITDQQKPAWTTYATAVRASLDPLRQDCASGQVGKRAATLPERLTGMQREADQRAASLRSMKPAVESLYSALSPDQKKTADRILLSPRGRG
jgi:periplasmic protein CpxP/Spy